MTRGQSSDNQPPEGDGQFPILQQGATVRDYIIEQFIASGGFGSVYRVRDARDDTISALKLLHPELRTRGDSFIRFLREAQVLERIQHPNIVEVRDSGALADGRAFVVTEFLSGSDLERHIERHGALTMREAMSILEPICDALAHAHEHGVVHRDIKASNIFLSERDGARRVVLLDFGLAKVLEQGGIDLTASRMTLGTPSCMSPEQIRGDKVDVRADIYAVGALVFHMLTAKPPFAGKSHTVVQYMHLHGQRPRPSAAAKVSVAVDDVISRAMDPDRDARFASVTEFLTALRAAEDSTRSSRRQRRAKHTQIRALGVYLDVRIAMPTEDMAAEDMAAEDMAAEDMDDNREGGTYAEQDDAADDERLLDQMDAVLDEAERQLTDAGFHVGLEGSSSTLYVRVLPAGEDQESSERKESAAVVAKLYRTLVERYASGSPLHVNICLHRDYALVSDGVVNGGDLMRLERWAPEADQPGIVGSLAAFEGLDVNTEPVADDDRLVRWVLPEHSEPFAKTAMADDSRQRLMHTQMLAQVGRQVAGIVHDLRSPLTVIQGNIELVLMALEDERPLTASHQKGLEDALESAHKLASIVSTILRASTIKSYGTDRRKIAMSAILEAALRLSRGQTRSRADIEVEHGDGLHVVGSPGRLTQVVVNLLVYMAQSMEQRDVIAIRSARNDRGRVELTIRCDSLDLVEDVQGHLFRSQPRNSDPSTGLGLSLVREILEAHGGSIAVASPSSGATAIAITLPSAD